MPSMVLTCHPYHGGYLSIGLDFQWWCTSDCGSREAPKMFHLILKWPEALNDILTTPITLAINPNLHIAKSWCAVCLSQKTQWIGSQAGGETRSLKVCSALWQDGEDLHPQPCPTHSLALTSEVSPFSHFRDLDFQAVPTAGASLLLVGWSFGVWTASKPCSVQKLQAGCSRCKY